MLLAKSATTCPNYLNPADERRLARSSVSVRYPSTDEATHIPYSYLTRPAAVMGDNVDHKGTLEEPHADADAVLSRVNGVSNVCINRTYPIVHPSTGTGFPQEEMPSEVAYRRIEEELRMDGTLGLKSVSP